MTAVKVCGVTCPQDAGLAIECGVDSIGLNLIQASPRAVGVAAARAISEAVAGRVEVVGVVADLSRAELMELRVAARLDLLQLHGDEPEELVQEMLPFVYKAVRIDSSADVARAQRYAGDRLLVDAKVAGRLGGTGKTLDWSLVQGLARERRLVLAGGLNPNNVVRAVREVRPWGVDVASGVEVAHSRRRKDPDRLRDFVEAVRSARE